MEKRRARMRRELSRPAGTCLQEPLVKLEGARSWCSRPLPSA